MARRKQKERSLSGPEKAVVVLLSLAEEASAGILKHLDPGDLTKISNYVNLLDEIPREKVDEVREEFGLTLTERTGGLSGAMEDSNLTDSVHLLDILFVLRTPIYLKSFSSPLALAKKHPTQKRVGCFLPSGRWRTRTPDIFGVNEAL